MKTATLNVKAVRPGFYGTRRRPGDTFPVSGEVDPKTGKPIGFSSHWMLDITAGEPEAPKGDGELTKAELKNALTALDIDFPPNAKKDDLKAIYAAAVEAGQQRGE